MYVHTYVYTCYVLIRPPIPYITSSRCKRLHKFCPVEILLHERGRLRVPPCNVLKNVFFFKAITLYFCVLFKFCFTREGAQGPPLVTSLKNVFFIFFTAITLYFCVLFKFCCTREGAQGSPLVSPLNNVFFKFLMQITS